MNLDYAAGLAADGIWGPASDGALKGHYVELGETQELVRAVQILLLLRQTDPKGVDAVFGSGTLAADGVAGYATIRSLLEV